MLPGNFQNKLKHYIKHIFNLRFAVVMCGSAQKYSKIDTKWRKTDPH
jgi:hypothetical protein